LTHAVTISVVAGGGRWWLPNIEEIEKSCRVHLGVMEPPKYLQIDDNLMTPTLGGIANLERRTAETVPSSRGSFLRGPCLV
jgi:hypothetical protein